MPFVQKSADGSHAHMKDDRGGNMKEVIFEVREDDIDGGYTASALGYGIHTEADSLDELKKNVKEAVECFFGEETLPGIVRLHFVRDEVLAV